MRLLQSQQAQAVNINHLLHMMHDIASGMKYLTDKGYVHTVNTTLSLLFVFCGPLCRGYM